MRRLTLRNYVFFFGLVVEVVPLFQFLSTSSSTGTGAASSSAGAETVAAGTATKILLRRAEPIHLLRSSSGQSRDDGTATTTTSSSNTLAADINIDKNNNGNSNNATTIPTRRIGIDVHGLPVEMPLVGAGTWQYNDTVAYQSLCKAFASGYTLVDTAFGYGNQVGVSKAIRDCYEGKRSELFVLTKVPGGLTFEETLAAHHQNMFQLDQEYVDHLMAHFPADWEVTPDRASKERRQEQWKALEEVYYSGKARSIGVSHYCPQHLRDILEIATVPISVNQVEYHVGSGDVDGVLEACRQSNITFMSFSPLCGPCQLKRPEDSLVTGELVTDIARKHNVTGAQVSLRYIVQQSLESNTSVMGAVVPKSNNAEHIRSNRDLFSFELSPDDMERLHAATEPEAEGGDCAVP